MSTSLPLVSIIIPVYNGAPTLAETIQNALDQSWPSKEIIVVDDGSSDDSLLVARNFEPQGVRVVALGRGGASRARNEGLKCASGRFIQFLDADDLLEKEKIANQVKMLLAAPDPNGYLCAGRWLRFAGDIHQEVGGIGPGGPAENDMDPMRWLALRPYNLMTIHAWLSPRAVLDKAGPWDETITLDDDGEYFIRAIQASKGVRFCKEALSYYRTVAGERTLSSFAGGQTSCVKLESAYRSLTRYRQVMDEYDDPKADEAVRRNYLYMAYNTFLDCPQIYTRCLYEGRMPKEEDKMIRAWLGGKAGLLSDWFGWRTVKRMKRLLGR